METAAPCRAPRVLAALALAVGLAACGGGGDGIDTAGDAAGTTTSSSDTTTTTQVVACVAGDLDPRTLAPRIIEEAAGFTVDEDAAADTGPSDLAKAISDDGEPDAERVLNATGFRAGYQRSWVNGTDRIVLFVYEFCKADGAKRYAGRTSDLFNDAGLPIQPVVGPEVGTGFTLAGRGGRGLWLWETSDTTLALVVTYGEQAEDIGALLQRASDVLVAQLHRLADSELDTV